MALDLKIDAAKVLPTTYVKRLGLCWWSTGNVTTCECAPFIHCKCQSSVKVAGAVNGWRVYAGIMLRLKGRGFWLNITRFLGNRGGRKRWLVSHGRIMP